MQESASCRSAASTVRLGLLYIIQGLVVVWALAEEVDQPLAVIAGALLVRFIGQGTRPSAGCEPGCFVQASILRHHLLTLLLARILL